MLELEDRIAKATKKGPHAKTLAKHDFEDHTNHSAGGTL
jgi:hypothetical protein